MNEREFMGRIVDLARTYGWSVAHFRPARTEKGWRTAVAYDGQGFPDLVLCHPQHGVIFAEVKAEGGRLSIEQERWLRDLDRAGARVFGWWPKHWDGIVAVLSGGRAAA